MEKKTALIHAISRISIASVWIYHGLIPKIIYRDWSEMTLLRQMGVDIKLIPALILNIGCVEIAFGLITLLFWKANWQLWATIGIMLGGLLSIAKHSPSLLHAAFNPVTLNGLMLAMAVIALLTQPPPAETD